MPGKIPNSIARATVFFSFILALLDLPLFTLARVMRTKVISDPPRFPSFLWPFHISRSVSILTLMVLLISPAQVWAEIALTITANPDPVRSAERVYYSLTVTNPDVVVRTNVRLQNQVPLWVMMDEDITLPRGGCSVGHSGDVCYPGETMNWLLGELGPGESREVILPAIVNADVVDGTLIDNLAWVTYDGIPVPITIENSVVVESTASLELSLVGDREPVGAGEMLTYMVTAGNRGTIDEVDHQLQVSVPEGTTFVSASEGGILSGGKIEWTLDSLDAGASQRHQFTVEVDGGSIDGDVVLGEAILYDTISQEIRSRASTTTVVRTEALGTLEITANPDPVRPGERVYYTLTVANPGTVTLTNVWVQDYVPMWVMMDEDITLPRGGCSVGHADDLCYPGETMTWTMGDLGPGESREVIVPAIVNSGDVDGTLIENLARITYDGIPSPITAEHTAVVESTASLELSLVGDREPVGVGELLTYTVTAGNRGTVDVVDNLLLVAVPEGTTFVSATEGGILSEGKVQWILGNLDAGGSVRRQFTVEVDALAINGAVLVGEAELRDTTAQEIRSRASVATAVRSEVLGTLTMIANTDPVRPGESIFYTLTVANPGAVTLTNVILQDYVPLWARIYEAVTVPRGACSVGHADDICYPGETMTWTLGDLGPGESREIVIPVLVNSDAVDGTLIENLARVIYDGIPAPVTAGQTAVVESAASLELSLDGDQEPVNVGELLTYTVTVGNRGMIEVVDNLLLVTVPEGTTFVSATEGGILSEGKVQWTLGSLGAGDSARQQFTVEVDAGAIDGDVLLSEAELRDKISQEIRSKASSSTVVRSEVLGTLTMTANPDPVRPGEWIYYTLTVSNPGVVILTNVMLQDHVPLWVRMDEDTSVPRGACSVSHYADVCYSGEKMTWTLGDLAPGESREVIVPAAVNGDVVDGTLIENRAHISYDGLPAPVTAQLAVIVKSTASLDLSVVADHEPVAVGEQLTYTLKVGNRGTVEVVDNILQVTLPEGTTFVSATGSGILTEGKVQWTLGSLGVGEITQREFTVEVNGGAENGDILLSEAEFRGIAGLEIRSRASVTTAVRSGVPVTLEMTANPDPVRPTERVYYTLTVLNRGDVALTNVTLQDHVPWWVRMDEDITLPRGACSVGHYGDVCYTGEKMTWLLGELGPGESREVIVPAIVNSGVVDGTLIENRAHVTYDGIPAPVTAESTVAVNLDAVPTLSGTVWYNGLGLSNVLITAEGTYSATATTDTAGRYSFAGLATDTYTLTPSRTGYTFDPLTRYIDILEGSAAAQDFRACLIGGTLSGVLRDALTREPLVGIDIYIDGSLVAITAADGSYSISGLDCGQHIISLGLSSDSGYVIFPQTVDTFNSWMYDIYLTTESTVLGLDTESAYANDPVNTATGNYVYQRRDLAIPGIGFPLRFDRTYNSREASSTSATGNPLGYGWSHSYHVNLSTSGDSVTLTWGDGHTETFTADGLGGYVPQYGVFDTLVDNGDGTFTLIKRNRTRYDFDTSGRLAAITDKNGNRLSLTYTGADLTELIETAGRTILLSYDTAGRITTITDPIGRTVHYTYDLNGNLIQAIDRNGNVTVYTYDAAHQILTVVDPRGHTVVSNTYDDANRVVTYQTDAKGNPTSFTYQELDRITTITDALGNVTVHQHDSLLRLIREEDARGAIAYYVYDTAGNRIAVTDKNGNLTQYGYDARGNVTTKLDALGNLVTLTYDEANNPLSRADALSNLTQFTYDANGNLTQTTDALDNNIAISYLPNGLPETITDALSHVTTNAYNVEGNLTTLTDALGNVTSFTYDGVGRRLTITDPNGNTTTTTYDANNNRLSVTDPMEGVISYTYDANDNKLSATDLNGNTTQWAYDEKDLRISETDALGQLETYEYDALDRRIAKTDRRNNSTGYAYDKVGNLIEVTDALNNPTRYSYDLNGNRLSVNDARDNTTQYEYDALNRRTQSIDALNNAIITTYDANGNRTTRTDRRGATTHYDYDKLNRLIQVTNALGHSQAFGYDANGNRISQTNALNHTNTFNYDELNRLTATTDPLGHTKTNQYDPGGRITAVIDANGETTSFAYDERNRLIQVTDAAGGIVTYGYDANGNRTSMIDPNEHSTTYAYNELNRRITQTEPLGHITSLVYDPVGNLSRRTDPKGQVTNYVYDEVNRLTTIDYASQADVSLTYDAVGNRLSLGDGLGSTSHSYDVLNRRSATTDPFGNTVGYGYDANGNRTRLTYPDSKAVTYTYDLLNRMTNVTDWLGNVTSYGYDEAGRLVGTLNANDTTTDYGYDAANRLTDLTNAKSDASIINAYSYTLDAVGNHLSEARTEPLLPEIPLETLTDTHDAENRLIERNTVPNSFDENGNLTNKGSNSYTYDIENRLIETNIDGSLTQYQYDGAGNRYARIRNGVTTHFVLDTNTSLTNVLVETNATGAIQAYNVYGKGLIARIGTDDSISNYHYDLRGSTIALTDSTQNTTQEYAYDPFGSIAKSSGTENNPFGFLGKHGIFNEGSDLNYIRARYYDVGLQRFVSKDVIFGNELQSQSMNRYSYAINNPVRLIDVSGYTTTEVIVEPNNNLLVTNTITFVDRLLGEEPDLTILENFLWELGGESVEEVAILSFRKAAAQFSMATDDYVQGALAADLWKVLRWAPAVSAIVSGGNEYYQSKDDNTYWMDKAARALFTTGWSAVGSLVGIGTTAVSGPVLGVAASSTTNTFGDTVYEEIIVNDFLTNVFYDAFYNPENQFIQWLKN